MPINSVSFLRDTILHFRDIISGGVVDPINNRQQQSGDAGSNARFVMTAWPQRAIVYPFITIQDVSTIGQNLGMQTEDALTRTRLQIDVWSKQIGQRDGITGSVYYALRTAQTGQDGINASGLFDLRLVSMRNLDEPGKAGVHRKSIDVEVQWIHT